MLAYFGRALGLIAVTATLTACGGGPISVRGRVVDHKGTPVTKAEVQTTPETDVVVTSSRGFFILQQRINDLGETEPILPGPYRIVVRKFGFEDLSFDVTVEDGPVVLEEALVLQPRTPDIEDTAPEVTEERQMAPDEGSVPVRGQ